MNPVTFDIMQVCKTVFSFFFGNLHLNVFQGEGWVERGCTLDQKEHSKWPEDVKVCSEPGCNFENVVHSHCMQCESDLEGECAHVISNKESFLKQCKGNYSYEKRGCYTMVKSKLFHL